MLPNLDGALDRPDARRRVLPQQLLHQVDALVGKLLLLLDLRHINCVTHDVLEELILIISIVRR